MRKYQRRSTGEKRTYAYNIPAELGDYIRARALAENRSDAAVVTEILERHYRARKAAIARRSAEQVAS